MRKVSPGAGPRGARRVGVGAGGGAMAATDSGGPGRTVAAQVSLPVPAPRHRPGRQLRMARRRGATVLRSQPVLRLRHALWLWLAAGAVCAQDITLQASVDRTTVRENESFTLYPGRTGPGSWRARCVDARHRLRGPAAQPKTPAFQMVGGRTSQITEWRFQLMPRRSGSFTLPPMGTGRYAFQPRRGAGVARPRQRRPRRYLPGGRNFPGNRLRSIPGHLHAAAVSRGKHGAFELDAPGT